MSQNCDMEEKQKGINDQSVDQAHIMISSCERNPTTLDGFL